MRLLLILSLALFACAPKTQELKGEVYIITAGRETVKLTGTNVHAVPLDVLQKHLQVKAQADPRNTEDASFYLSGLQESASSTVDLDGKFSITVPPGEYALVVMDSRKVFGNTEFYYWAVKASPQTTLSNSNLNGAGDSLLPRRFSLP